MRTVKRITPTDGSGEQSLGDLEVLFLDRVLNSANRELKGELKVLKNASRGKARAIYTFIFDNLDRLLVGKPTYLKYVVDLFERENYSDYLVKKKKVKEKLTDVFGYERFRDSIKRGVWYANQLNIKVCPYCNANYTLVNGKDELRFHYDHFFPKESYPFLSISMYNLIPVCSYCNQKKGAKLFNLRSFFHPYYNSLDARSRVVLKLSNLDLLKGIKHLSKLSEDHFTCSLEPVFRRDRLFVRNHDDQFGITNLYSRHGDHVKEVVLKARLYNMAAKKGLLAGIKGLFPDIATMNRYIFSNYLEIEEVNERPLSKLYRDILLELGVKL